MLASACGRARSDAVPTEQDERPEAVMPTAYATLYPTCRVQSCQDDPEPGSLACNRHQLVDAF